MTQFHLARFGNKSGAHDVLGHSGVNDAILTAIVWRTDAPALSEGLGLEPFVSAYRLGDTFIVTSTSADHDADRAGMVVTTAAVVPIAAAELLDLNALWQILCEPIPVELPLDASSYVIGPAEPGPHTHPAGAQAAASALIAKGRVIWAGPGFEDAVACIWAHLRRWDRMRLVVGAAAHPDRISLPTESDSLQIIKTATTALSRWVDWPTASDTSAQVPDRVRDAMFGDDAGLTDQLANRLGLDHVEFTTGRHLATAAILFDRLRTLDHEGTRGLLQLLGLIQPAPTRGTEVKGMVLEYLSDLTSTAAFVDVRGLRGIPWQAFGSGVRSQLLTQWAMTTVPQADRTNEVVAAATALQSEVGDSFLTELDLAISSAIDDGHLERLVGATLTAPDGAQALSWLVKVRTTRTVDDAVHSSVVFGSPVPTWLQTAAQALRLPVAHALSVHVTDPVAAWKEHLALRSRRILAEDILAARTREAGVVAAAVALGDSELLDRAARLTVTDPSLLGKGDINDVSFRTLWFAATRAGGDPWASVRPADALFPLLDLLVAGDHVEAKVLELLSQTTSADISNYPSRASVWSKLPPTAVTGFKEATAQTIARSFKSGDVPIEQPLVATVLSPTLLASVSRESTAQALALLSSVPDATASNAITVLENGNFTPTEETTFGNLVRTRRWRFAAERIITLSGARSDLTRAAALVDSMFGLLDRLTRYMTSGSPVVPQASERELIDALTDVAAQLYNQGPTSDALWERAGGSDADLVAGTTGRLTWGRALQDVIAGRTGAPSLEALLATMLEDYSSNQQLQALKKTIENGTVR